VTEVVFHTGVPFGYAGFWGGLSLLALGACALIVSGVRSSARRRVGLGRAALATIVTFTWLNVSADRNLDLNPAIYDRGEIVGQWTDHNAALALQVDGTYTCRGKDACAELGTGGTWTWTDFRIVFHPSVGNEVLRRLVRYRRELRLTSLFADPDTWDGRLSFRCSSSHG
jgi:hypothetical protein